MIFKDVKTLRKWRVAAPIGAIGAQCITTEGKILFFFFFGFKYVFYWH